LSTLDRAQWLITTDLERRLRLRAFLMHARSRLAPRDVGLPETGRRRVPGLRREEVAELAGISPEWYRLFESGRPITVSSHVLERISVALALDAFDQSTLFRLALPELYRAQIVALAEPPPTMTSLVAPMTTLSDVEAVRRSLIAQRENFFTSTPSDVETPQGGAVQTVRPRILNSWRRSHELRVEAGRSEARLEDQHAVDSALALAREQLLRVSGPILTHLADMLADIGYAIVLTDARGTILDLRCDLGMRRKLDPIGFQPGADWSEASTGTNAIGTALSDDRPLQLMAAEHYCDGWQDLMCTAAPIHDPQTGRVIGALDITGDYHLIRPQLIGTIVQYALEIEERLATRDR
jgi:transcriptional regulator with XRE-family HTH domain